MCRIARSVTGYAFLADKIFQAGQTANKKPAHFSEPVFFELIIYCELISGSGSQ